MLLGGEMPEAWIYLQGLLRQGRSSEDGILTEPGDKQLTSETREAKEGRTAVSCSTGSTASCPTAAQRW